MQEANVIGGFWVQKQQKTSSQETTLYDFGMEFHALIPAGGSGRRLWPVSTAVHPKFLLPLDVGACAKTGSLGASPAYTLAQRTAARLAPLAASLTWITGKPHESALREQIKALELPTTSRFVVEPEARDSMAAIGLGAALVERDFGVTVVGSFAADHHLGNLSAFAQALQTAILGAESGKLVTIGIAPTAPATGYGYIEIGEEEPGISGLHLVKRFKEKPDQATAQAYLQTEKYLWNAGMFVFRTDVLFAALEREAPGSPAALRELAKGWETLKPSEKLELWQRVVHAPIDTVLAEPMSLREEVAVVPAAKDIDWSDIGDWQAIYELSARDSLPNQIGHLQESGMSRPPDSAEESGKPLMNLSPKTPVFTEKAPGALVLAPELAGVAIVGIPGAVVVIKDNQLLVTTREYAQDVKAASLAADQWSQPGES